MQSAFMDALFDEMHLRRSEAWVFDTIYIGGGTPSLLDAKAIDQILENAHQSYQIFAEPEITLEINPGTVASEQLKGYKHAGVNRINIGVQSFDPAGLGFLGRTHSVDAADRTIKWSHKAGFEKMGLDLIYGIPEQTKQSWLSDLQRAVAFEPQHISCYMLTYEPGTPLDKDRRKKRFIPLSDDMICELYEATITFLSSCGYAQYEISNFAHTGSGKIQSFNPEHNQSKHNQKYWSFVPYIGLGPSAHSFIEPQRFWNHSSVKKYIEDLATNRLPLKGKETLNQEQLIMEAIYLGLRQTKGISVDFFEQKFGQGFNAMFGGVVKDLEEKGLIKFSQNSWALTLKGMLLLDSVVAAFT
jgi:oxygen-independent coproporphyrinogen-3 oxidase